MEDFIKMPLKLKANGANNTGFKLKNINNSGKFRSYTPSALVTNGLTLHLDPNNSESYSGTGTTWFDISGNDADITLVNTPTYNSGAPSYFTFNGTNEYGTGTKGNVIPTTEYTKIVWFYLNGYLDNNLVSSATGGHFLFMGASSNKIYSGHANWNLLGGTYLDYPSTSTINLNTWYNVALTFNTTDGMTLYINGAQDSTYTARKNAHSGNGSTNIATFGGGNLLNGRVGEVFCYNRKLTGGEILQNYNSTKNKY
jgi:hypothetical protein